MEPPQRRFLHKQSSGDVAEPCGWSSVTGVHSSGAGSLLASEQRIGTDKKYLSGTAKKISAAKLDKLEEGFDQVAGPAPAPEVHNSLLTWSCTTEPVRCLWVILLVKP
jgi:hypothetical protein